jgi:anti-sigma B factor antagonist
MPQAKVVMNVRKVNPTASVIDIQGEVTAFAEQVLMEAYAEASSPTTRVIILNFSGLEYMNSSGIGLLVTLLIRVNRQKQRLFSYGLNEHYRHIFTLTRISDAIHIYNSEEEALAASA